MVEAAGRRLRCKAAGPSVPPVLAEEAKGAAGRSPQEGGSETWNSFEAGQENKIDTCDTEI